MNRTSRTLWIAAAVMAAVALFGGFSALNAQEEHHHQDGAGAAASEQLHHTMEQMGKLFRTARNALKDTAKYAEAADAVTKLEMETIKAKAMTPEHITKMPADQQAAALKQYRVNMCELLGDLSQLEAAFVQGDQARATAAIQACNEIMKKGHMAFREND